MQRSEWLLFGADEYGQDGIQRFCVVVAGANQSAARAARSGCDEGDGTGSVKTAGNGR